MEVKANKATRNRPEGDRVLDAPYVFANLQEYIQLIKDEKLPEANDRKGITIFKSDEITMVLSVFLAGAIMDNVNVNGYMSLQVIDGKARIITTDGDRELGPNGMVVFHPGVEHSIQGIDNCIVLLTPYNAWTDGNSIF